MIDDWLPGYLTRVSGSFDPHDWPAPKTDEWKQFAKEWHSAFARHGISEAEADAARELAVEDPPRFKPDYIPKIIAAARVLREIGQAKGVPAETPALVPDLATIAASRGCPECTRERGRLRDVGPTGWARRLAAWDSVPRPFTVELFCRCPLGRWRRAHDVELLRGEKVRQHDDLQARPELWDLEAEHPSWSWRSVAHDLVMPEGTEGKWHYFGPGEVAPEPIAPSALAGRMSRDMEPYAPNRKPEWMGKIPDGIEMPRRVAREPEPPPPPLPVEPLPQLSPDELEWF